MRLRTLSASALAATALFPETPTATQNPGLGERNAATMTTYTIYRTVQRVVATTTASSATVSPSFSSGTHASGSIWSASGGMSSPTLTLTPFANGTASALSMTPTVSSSFSGVSLATGAAGSVEGAAAGKGDVHVGVWGAVVLGMGMGWWGVC
ncbi:hypothetical protein Tdes44962_MAKER05993 [Teratosphaeria destructans]|uniref:Uncharacterized protein n=1 Tax=Teratosphaeria destructans TaxID=418781 RepID=A0A9W7VYH2_9PEZI|nr:hypothetical protein Tdes44962_MAKER05993 [Teratosphaeria destructans]